MKSRRQELILRAAEHGNVHTQEQILEYLQSHGVAATQATVSRDMRVLGLKKTVGKDGKTTYELRETAEAEALALARRRRALIADALLSVDGAGHMVCVHCSPGMAQGACAALDAMPPAGVVGSLAGEDTIFLLCRTAEDTRAVQEEILRLAKQDL
ncbi:MAG: arginine repressor [Oscillospiraceae bacterium]|nr:arginine repressor [Oscillospiraceae bacterium]